MMKNYYFIFIFLIFGFNSFMLYSNVEKKDLTILSNLTFEYDSKIYLKDITTTNSQNTLDTSKLGSNVYIDDDYYIKYNVVDTTKPLIIGSTTKTTTLGNDIDLVNKYLCGDNHDNEPKCYIRGKYDINKIGKYNLTYVAEDKSGNIKTKDIILNVIEKSNSENRSDNEVKLTPIKDYIKKYKNEKTKIGIDVSAWQDDIDWSKVKKDGVEFAIIRIGFGHTNKGEIKLDNWYLNNIKKAQEQNIDIGLYFYSYAKNEKEVKEQVDFIVNTLDHQKIQLPIAFDWEDWSDFNSYKMSFKKLNDLANTFIEELYKNGYEGMLYSSAYYLNNIWKDYDKTWLAYYTNNNDFKKDYMMWQFTSTGQVNGINGAVDLNVLYLK